MSEAPSGAWKLRARRDGYTDGIELAVWKGENFARLVFEPFDRHSYVTDPTIRDHGDFLRDGYGSFLQAALDAAWELGMRPAGFNDTRESMAATKAHLEDMRALAFHKTGAAKP